ncbi:MAG: hypothetical protein ACK5MI_05700 [Mangrovibacterium sp.]
MQLRLKSLAMLTVLLLGGFCAKAQDESVEKEKLHVKVGGLVRYNYNVSEWKDQQVHRGGDFGSDVFGVNAYATYGKLYLDAEYRIQNPGSGGGFLRRGYFGYKINDNNEIKLGMVAVPFGNHNLNSHSFFFSSDYYYGLEDDWDMGVTYTHNTGDWTFDLGFMKNAEDRSLGNNSDVSYSRYGYDVASMSTTTTDAGGNEVTTLSYRNKEANQINGRVLYHFGNGSNCSNYIGASAEWGQLYNIDAEDFGDHYAWGAHYDGYYGNWNLKAQVTQYKYNPLYQDGETEGMIVMAAYGSPEYVAAKSTNYTTSLTYSLNLKKSKYFDKILFYNEFSVMDKANKDFANSLINTCGACICAGPLIIYVDYVMGKNDSALGNNSEHAFAEGDPNAPWNRRLNINMGFYF